MWFKAGGQKGRDRFVDGDNVKSFSCVLLSAGQRKEEKTTFKSDTKDTFWSF